MNTAVQYLGIAAAVIAAGWLAFESSLKFGNVVAFGHEAERDPSLEGLAADQLAKGAVMMVGALLLAGAAGFLIGRGL